jgi:metal-responsive CopG/Arc/MetJ family transcriptional regulator
MEVGMRTKNSVSLSLPPELIKEAERIAKEEGRTKSELIEKALRIYVRQKEWRELQKYGARQAKKLGIKESDVERLIEEYRKGI